MTVDEPTDRQRLVREIRRRQMRGGGDGPSRPTPEGRGPRWVIEFLYEFEFDDNNVTNDAEAKALGYDIVDETVRSVLVTHLREFVPTVEVGPPEATYSFGSVRTRGLDRILAEFKDVPIIADHLKIADWFWRELERALSDKLNRKVALRRKWSGLGTALPADVYATRTAAPSDDRDVSDGEAAKPVVEEVEGRDDSPEPNFWDRYASLAKIIVVAALIAGTLGLYKCDRDDDDANTRSIVAAIAASRVTVVQNNDVTQTACCGAQTPPRPCPRPPRPPQPPPPDHGVQGECPRAPAQH